MASFFTCPHIFFYVSINRNLVHFMKNKLSDIQPDNSKYPAGYRIVRFCHYPSGLSGWILYPVHPLQFAPHVLFTFCRQANSDYTKECVLHWDARGQYSFPTTKLIQCGKFVLDTTDIRFSKNPGRAISKLSSQETDMM